jgi:hypothetical protein
LFPLENSLDGREAATQPDGAQQQEGVALIGVGQLAPSDRGVWEQLFRGYIDFYQRTEPPQMYERAWGSAAR